MLFKKIVHKLYLRRVEKIIERELNYISKSPFIGKQFEQVFSGKTHFSNTSELARFISAHGWEHLDEYVANPYTHPYLFSALSINFLIGNLTAVNELSESGHDLDEMIPLFSICLARLIKILCHAPPRLPLEGYEHELLLELMEVVDDRAKKDSLDRAANRIFNSN